MRADRPALLLRQQPHVGNTPPSFGSACCALPPHKQTNLALRGGHGHTSANFCAAHDDFESRTHTGAHRPPLRNGLSHGLNRWLGWPQPLAWLANRPTHSNIFCCAGAEKPICSSKLHPVMERPHPSLRETSQCLSAVLPLLLTPLKQCLSRR